MNFFGLQQRPMQPVMGMARPQMGGNTFLGSFAALQGGPPMQPARHPWGDRGGNTFLGALSQMQGGIPALPGPAAQSLPVPAVQGLPQNPNANIAQLLMKGNR